MNVIHITDLSFTRESFSCKKGTVLPVETKDGVGRCLSTLTCVSDPYPAIRQPSQIVLLDYTANTKVSLSEVHHVSILFMPHLISTYNDRHIIMEIIK